MGAIVLAFAFVLGCGHEVQRAAMSAPAPAASAALLDVTPAAEEYAIDVKRSRFEIFGSDIFGTDHKMWFTAWKARVRTAPVPSITAEVDMRSVDVDMAGARKLVKTGLLEADQFPTSTLTATMRRTGRVLGEHVVEGIAELHGVRKGLRFTGNLVAEGAGYRFTAEFVISRKAFGIRYAPAEPFLRDDVRVVIDVLALPVSASAAPRVEQPVAQPP